MITQVQVSYKSSYNKSVGPIGPSCKKNAYNSREEAEDMIRYIQETRYTKELHAYECLKCGMWHLSSSTK